MKISNENYEIWFLDYYEGQLAPEQVQELMNFLELNLDLKEEFEQFENITLIPEHTEKFDDKEKAEVNVALCKGCGVCVTSCRSGAPDLKGFTTGEIMAQLDALEGVF